MQKTALSSGPSDVSLSVDELSFHGDGWLLDCQVGQHSRNTLSIRRFLVDKLLWFLNVQGLSRCGKAELRRFFAYVTSGHTDEGGRWGNPAMRRPVSKRTVNTYYGHLNTLFRWIVTEGALPCSPMDTISVPISRADQINPFSDAQIEALLSAARRSQHPRRDEALILLLFDTGLRASEACGLRLADLDMQAKRCRVLGKGDKHRSLPFERTTAQALWKYLREEPREPSAPVFLSDRGTRAGEPLTRWGVRQIVERLGKASRVESVRCSPHTFRHTFAVAFLRNGGNVFTLQELLGHTDLKMTNRYVKLAQADIENQHRQFSPVEHLKRRNR